jgi:hypothetical protein
MSGFKLPDFADRRSASEQARRKALDKYKAMPKPGDPEFERRQAERLAAARQKAEREEAARTAKLIKEAEEKAAIEAKLAAERAAEEARIAAQKAAEEAVWQERQRVEAEKEEEMRLAREARYAARRAAKKTGMPLNLRDVRS